MEFQFRHVGRTTYPTKQILVCEDDLEAQAQIARQLVKLFEPQGDVHVSYVSGGLQAASIISSCPDVKLVILDHDMPLGNGSDLVRWLVKNGKQIPIMTFSGVDSNNDRMIELAEDYQAVLYRYSKSEVLSGMVNDAIVRVVNAPDRLPPR